MDIHYADFEAHGFDDTGLDAVRYANVPDPRYDGLNRAQRRKAMAVENKAFRKRFKKALPYG